jgi:hypothetical protein
LNFFFVQGLCEDLSNDRTEGELSWVDILTHFMEEKSLMDAEARKSKDMLEQKALAARFPC